MSEENRTKNTRVFFVLAASWRWSGYSLPGSRGEENLKKKMSSNVVVYMNNNRDILGCYTGRGSTGGRCHFRDQQGGVQRLNSYHHPGQV